MGVPKGEGLGDIIWFLPFSSHQRLRLNTCKQEEQTLGPDDTQLLWRTCHFPLLRFAEKYLLPIAHTGAYKILIR